MNRIISRRDFVGRALSLGALIFTGSGRILSGDSALPEVLIIGDSISIGYTPFVKEMLKGKAEVSHPDGNCEGTTKGVMKIDEWLGKKKWAVIYFNFGLHDLKHVNPLTGAASVNPSDPRQADVSQYAKNLKTIIRRLNSTGARLIFATTTPVPERSSPLREPEQVIIYNKAALKVTKKEGIKVDDLYGFALPKIKDIQLPNNVHFTNEGYRALAEKVSASILVALNQ
jgi:lysophospholipase L1-like esterase